MNVLVIGSGGREHAVVWKLAQSARVANLYCAPGNAGMAEEELYNGRGLAQCVPVAADDLPGLAALALEKKIDLTVVGPDNPLALGVVDLFQKKGLRIWGPSQQAAQFESSKVFSQRFMEKYGVPTARSGIFTEPLKAKDFAATLKDGCAVKADGLALGKGVIVCHSVTEAHLAVDEMLVNNKFGAASRQIVIQELLVGTEISLHALCDGATARLFPSSQDHKRLSEHDSGPNTGGMGAYAPTPFLSAEELAATGKAILDPWLKGCKAEGIEFCGLLYPGVMLTATGPKILEFNARFGDPEAQVYLPLLENDLIDVLEASVDRRLAKIELKWRSQTAVCVVMAAEGYPGSVVKGRPIRGLFEASRVPETKIFHAGTARANDTFVTNGGRVLGVTAWGGGLAQARERAYCVVEKIQFDGAQYRRDIGAKAFNKTIQS